MVEATSTETQPTETKSFEGEIENAYGKEISEYKLQSEDGKPVTVVTFSGTYEHINSYEGIPAKELPDREDVLALVNNKRKANARQQAMQAALDAAGVKKPTLESDQDLQIATLVKVYMAAGRSRQEAEQIAKSSLGIA